MHSEKKLYLLKLQTKIVNINFVKEGKKIKWNTNSNKTKPTNN